MERDCPRILSRTYMAEDECGNTSTCIQTITVSDIIPPVITCPAPVTVSCVTDIPAPDISLVTATDNCGIPVIIWQGDRWNGLCPRIVTRTYQAIDSCGNTSTCSQIITVFDTIDPVIVTCPSDVILTANANCEIIVPDFTTTIIATDNCGIATITQLPAPGTLFSPVSFGDTIVVTLFVTDSCSNMATCTANIIIGDNFPLAVDDNAGTINEDTPITIDVLINDSWGCDGPSSSPITVATQPANGTAVVQDGGTPTDPTDDMITYTPDLNYNGPDSFTYTICDSDGDCSTATVIIMVIAVNDPPVTFNEFIELCQGSAFSGSVWNGEYDPEGTALFTQTIPVKPPTHGTFTINTTAFTLTTAILSSSDKILSSCLFVTMEFLCLLHARTIPSLSPSMSLLLPMLMWISSFAMPSPHCLPATILHPEQATGHSFPDLPFL